MKGFLFGDDGEFFTAMRADELGVGDVGFSWDGIKFEMEWCFGDESFDCGVECVCDFLECFERYVPVEVVLDGSFRDAQEFGEFGLVEFSDLEDEPDVFCYVHDDEFYGCKGRILLSHMQMIEKWSKIVIGY